VRLPERRCTPAVLRDRISNRGVRRSHTRRRAAGHGLLPQELGNSSFVIGLGHQDSPLTSVGWLDDYPRPVKEKLPKKRGRLQLAPAKQVQRYGAGLSLPEWAARLRCSECGSNEVDFVVSGGRR